jgi:hypothetical protein
MNRYNLAARAARWSATHWKTAVAAWIALVAVAIGLGMTVGTHELSSSEQATGETAQAEQILASAGFKTPAAESVLIRSSTRTVADAEFRSTVQTVLAKLRTMPQVTNLRTGARRESSIRPTRGYNRCSMLSPVFSRRIRASRSRSSALPAQRTS